MMKKLLIALLLCSPCYSLNLDTFWVGDGSFKLPRQDKYPAGDKAQSVTTNWDGVKAITFGGRNETVSLVVFMGATTSNATEVNIQISSFTGPSGAGIVSTPVTGDSIFDWTTRPVELFYVRYLQIKGMSQLMMEPSEYDAYHYPPRFRRPCTINGTTGQCSPNGGTLFTDRPDANKFYPEILIPYEAIQASSFTVSASSSQAIWADIFIPKGQTPGLYTATITIKEGVVVSTTIPVELTVKSYTLPDSPNFKMIGFISNVDISGRHFGSVGTYGIEPGYTTRKRYRQMLKRHKFAGVIDDNDIGTSDHPYAENINSLSGSLFAGTTGYGNAPGISSGLEYYSIGTYGKFTNGSWTDAGTISATFCGHVNNWATWFRDNYPSVKSFLYLTDEPADLTNTNKWSTWMSTSCAQTATYRVKPMVTAGHVAVNSGSPYTQYPFSTTYMGTSSTTVDTTVSSYTTHQGISWYYNSYTPFTGLSMTEAGGYEPREIPIGAYKKGVMGWFFWETTYYNGANHAYCRTPDDNNIWTDAQTFGCDGATYNTVKGMTSYQFANGDGVLMYPLTDTVDSGNSYALNGPASSWRLKMWRRGIQDVDLFVMANAANPSATATALTALVGGKVMWEYNCWSLGDCTYGYGPRGFSETFSDYEAQRLVLSGLIPADTMGTSNTTSGPIIFGGGVELR